MDTPRFFVKNTQIKNSHVVINDIDDIRKITKVLRLQPNDQIMTIDETGQNYLCEISHINKKEISANIIKKINLSKNKPKPYIILAQALTRAGKIDDIIRMNTEIGVKEFIFFESNYSVFKLKNFKESKLIHWQKIAKEATRQSEQSLIPQISLPQKFEDIITQIDCDIKILLSARNGENFAKVVKNEVKNDSKVLILIGPEGGFNDEEVLLAKKSGTKISKLNLPILRTQTAGIVAASFIMLSKSA